MLNLPIYDRGSSYYLHTRIDGKQVKKSLYTKNKSLAISRGIRILETFAMAIKRYEIDLAKNIFKTDGSKEDHDRLVEALGVIERVKVPAAQVQEPSVQSFSAEEKGLRLTELFDKFLLMKKHLRVSTVLSYTTTLKELADFTKNPLVSRVGISTITRFQENLANKGNTARTIDSKVGSIRAVFNFAIKQGYYFDKNPAENRALQSKKERRKSGWVIFEDREIEGLYNSEFLKNSKNNDPDYYWVVVLGLVTGCRISEITGLVAEQIVQDSNPYIKVQDAKSPAGNRKVPIPVELLNAGFADFVGKKTGLVKIFKYKDRLGKGSGNAVYKKFMRNLEAVNLKRPKLVFHSLRKYVNNFMRLEKVSLENRCQFIGHEFEHVNIQDYSEELSVKDLTEIVNPVQIKLCRMAGLLN